MKIAQFSRHIFIDYKNNKERESALRNHYTIGGHMAFHDALMAEKFRIFMVSSLTDKEVREAGMMPVKNVSEGIDAAKKLWGSILQRILYLTDMRYSLNM